MDLSKTRVLLPDGYVLLVIFIALLVTSVVNAKVPADNLIDNSYIVELTDPPLVYFDGDNSLLSASSGKIALKATSPRATGSNRLDTSTPDAKAYRSYLNQRINALNSNIEAETGIKIKTKFRYYNLINGFAAEMDAATAEQIRQLPGVKSVIQDREHTLHTYAGPEWIGARQVWDGVGGLPETKGEGVVVGIIDTGINTIHQSFAATGGDGYTHTNPGNGYLGNCGQSGVVCNDKLIGVYNFTTENSKGIDQGGHGSHVAGTAAGNVLNNVTFDFGGQLVSYDLSGVAPHANIISYQVCISDDPDTEEDEGTCQGTAIAAALERAVDDNVDIVNYSIGLNAQPSPWNNNNTAPLFLALREAGIFAATSAGNKGPGEYTVGSPANAPWVTSVAAATHDGVTGTRLAAMSGGDTSPPANMLGRGATGGLSKSDIVYAGDFGNAQCAEGPPEPKSTCAANTGASKPAIWNSQTFVGKIVACDRGTYGRIEKGKNVMLSGAVGYILLNTPSQGESIVADEHCIPAVHLGVQKGDILRDWLTSGSGHRARIDGVQVYRLSEEADLLASFSSRGPLYNPEGILKPNIMAPGVSVLAAASGAADSFRTMQGTSMSSPHVAGAAALIKSANPSWGPDQIASALELTATMEQAHNFNGEPANFNQVGAGRVQVDQAVISGLHLRVTGQEFRNANPGIGGLPQTLNLVGMTNPDCKSSCGFSRRVSDAMGGGSWSVSVEGPADISVQPSQFTLFNGSSRSLLISVDTSAPDSVGKWNYGTVVLTNTDGNAPDARLPLAVFSDPGNVPAEILINTPLSSGSQLQGLSGLAAMSDAEFQGAGLIKPTITNANIFEDPTHDEPFNGDGGNIVEFFEVTEDTLLLRAITESAFASDMDLYIGRDIDGDGSPDESEVVCSSDTRNTANESCGVSNPVAGIWWVMMQAYSTSGATQARLSAAVLDSGAASTLTATGPAILAENASGNMRISWHNVSAESGEELWGAVAIGTDPANPQNIGVVPVIYTRTGEDDLQESIVLGNDSPASFILPANAKHKRLVFDVPPGGGSVDFSLTAKDSTNNSNLKLQVHRMTFPNAFNQAPFVTEMPDGLPLKGQDTGGAMGPAVSVSGVALNPGRYYMTAENLGGNSIAVTAKAVYQGASPRVKPRTGLWGDGSYGAAGAQGFEYAEVNGVWFGIWYTYNEDGTPTWYFIDSGALDPMGNSHTADILEFTNNPNVNPPTQKFTVVGKATFTAISETDMKISYFLNGKYGGSSAVPLSTNTCVMQDGSPAPITGTWAPNINIAGGIGGSSVEYGNGKALVHYVYDDNGEPRWVISGNATTPAPATEAWEFRGYCPTCNFVQPTYTTVGTISQTYSSATEGSQILDFTLQAPNNSVFDRTMDVSRLSGAIDCQ